MFSRFCTKTMLNCLIHLTYFLVVSHLICDIVYCYIPRRLAKDEWTVQTMNKNWFNFSDIKINPLIHKIPVSLQTFERG